VASCAGQPKGFVVGLLEIDDPAPICDCTLHPHRGRHLPSLTTDKVSRGETPEGDLVTWMDEVWEVLAEHLLGAQPDKLLDVVARKDHLPTRTNHEAEAVETGEKIEAGKLIFFLFVLCLRLPLQLVSYDVATF